MATIAPRLDSSHAHRQRLRLEICGAVQGVGFRPLVHRLAVSEGLAGFVRNGPAGVTLEIEGDGPAIEHFLARLEQEAKPPAAIHRVERTDLDPLGEDSFAIAASKTTGVSTALILPDLALCDDCRAELRDPANRRYRYPFTTCTQCGPRYSLIDAVPYDRARTAMHAFPMCPACQAEYDDPASRRFHAETNACPECGPCLALLGPDGAKLAEADTALGRTIQALNNGAIVALKGVGGFQLLVDARNDAAVTRLRQRKQRPGKPFAVMVSDIDAARAIAHVSTSEEALLCSAAAPIVLLRARTDAPEPLAPSVAPANPDLGILLPATPLHQLLADALGFPIVATSGNRSGEPLAATDEGALECLSDIADLFLSHDRAILHPLDDSVVRVIASEATVLRNARGYAPLHLRDPRQGEPVLALGAHMKSSIALRVRDEIVLGPHIGDLDSAETQAAFERSINAFSTLHGCVPAIIACDTHPDYASTRLTETLAPPVRKVPHHLAHILAAMIDHDLDAPVLGIAWDGTGHGADGTIWGGEAIAVDGDRYRRVGHLLPFRLPGGEHAMREPRRTALGALYAIDGAALWDRPDLAPLSTFTSADRPVLATMLSRGLNSPLTSSAGRLFDAVSSILDLCQRMTFEGEAAMAIEFAASRAGTSHPLPPIALIEAAGQPIQLDWRPMLAGLTDAMQDGAPIDALAAGFHDALVRAIVAMAEKVGLERLVLTGGCFQNAVLTERAIAALREAGFVPYRHRRVPPNDGGLAVGQAAFAARALQEETGPCALPYQASC